MRISILIIIFLLTHENIYLDLRLIFLDMYDMRCTSKKDIRIFFMTTTRWNASAKRDMDLCFVDETDIPP